MDARDEVAEQAGACALLSVGLTEIERTVYEALVERGTATAPALRGTAGGSSDELARTLRGLEAKGLVSRIAGRPVAYEAVPPEVGLELLFVQREEELRKARLVA